MIFLQRKMGGFAGGLRAVKEHEVVGDRIVSRFIIHRFTLGELRLAILITGIALWTARFAITSQCGR